jgi:hypothetical protein
VARLCGEEHEEPCHRENGTGAPRRSDAFSGHLGGHAAMHPDVHDVHCWSAGPVEACAMQALLFCSQ